MVIGVTVTLFGGVLQCGDIGDCYCMWRCVAVR